MIINAQQSEFEMKTARRMNRNFLPFSHRFRNNHPTPKPNKNNQNIYPIGDDPTEANASKLAAPNRYPTTILESGVGALISIMPVSANRTARIIGIPFQMTFCLCFKLLPFCSLDIWLCPRTFVLYARLYPTTICRNRPDYAL
jgi:hypothetical protein